jgi:hypothetical protein
MGSPFKLPVALPSRGKKGHGLRSMAFFISRLLKNGHLLRFPHPSSLRRTAKYASLHRISGALHLALFEQPGKDDFFSSLLGNRECFQNNSLISGKGSKGTGST